MMGRRPPPDFLLGEPHPCGYRPGATARSIFYDPRQATDLPTYSLLVENGFRRSGDYLYRPYCGDCRSCRPLRVAAAAFAPRRSDRRNLRRNADLTVTSRPPRFSAEYFDLYCAYQAGRHPGGGMDEPAPGDFLGYLTSPWSPTRFYEFRAGDRLLAVAVVDRLLQGLSAVYTFYDPAEGERGLGTHAVLWQLGETRRLGLPWLYLGYWVAESRKMAYKAHFRPCQVLGEGGWEGLGEG